MSGAEASATNTAAHTADTPQLLLDHHLKELRLPTSLREYDKVARQCAVEQVDYQHYLLRITELELLDRERRATARIAVHLGQHHPGDAEGVVEALRDAHGVLPGHPVSHQQDLVRPDRGLDAGELVHHLVVVGVLLLGTVEGEDGDVVVTFGAEAHRCGTVPPAVTRYGRRRA